MPFLTLNDQARELAANRRRLQAQLEAEQDAAQTRREFWYAVRFSLCLLGGVGVGAFLFAVLVTL